MLAYYNGILFEAGENETNIVLWRYYPVDWCSKKQTDRGTIYYETIVPLAKIDAMFSVDFYGVYHEKEFELGEYNGKTAWIGINNITFARENDFHFVEHGCWEKEVSIDEFTELRIRFRYHFPEKKSDTLLIYRSQFDIYWKRYIEDFIPVKSKKEK